MHERRVVRLPVEIDMCNADHVAGELHAAVCRGADVVVADMTHTVFCE